MRKSKVRTVCDLESAIEYLPRPRQWACQVAPLRPPFAADFGSFSRRRQQEAVKAALAGALVPALTASGQCGTKVEEGEGGLPLSDTLDLVGLSVRSSPEFYTSSLMSKHLEPTPMLPDELVYL